MRATRFRKEGVYYCSLEIGVGEKRRNAGSVCRVAAKPSRVSQNLNPERIPGQH